MVIFGSCVARTPAASVICGTGVPRNVAVARGVGASVGDAAVREIVPTPDARAVGVAAVVGTGDGDGAIVGASVRNGGLAVGSGSGSTDASGCSATGGCSGALAFFGCASAYVVDPTIVRPVTTIAMTRSAHAGT